MEVNGYKIEPGASLSVVKMKKVVRSLVVGFVFLTGCSSSSTSSTTTVNAVDTVNGYRIEAGADLTGANLAGTDLTDAYLVLADLTGATMPDGSIHDQSVTCYC